MYLKIQSVHIEIYGARPNKGVISRIVEDHIEVSDEVKSKLSEVYNHTTVTIVDDERMPYYIQDGKRVYADVQMNTSGSIRR